MSNKREWTITSQESGLKLLVFLSQRLEGKYSARFLKNLIEHNNCKINGRTERFAATLLGKGDRVCLYMEDISTADHGKHQVETDRIIFEDSDLFVYNKPSGINSDENGILKLLQTKIPSLQLVHRLDQDTTGVLILAKQSIVFEKLVIQFKQLQVFKRYLAIVDGIVSQPKGIIENYLGKKQNYAGQAIWGAVPQSEGLYAYSAWERLKVGDRATLLACMPKTGRTHQIRVHMAEIGHPILGDFQYSKQFYCPYHPFRYLLHAEEIRIQHPLTNVPLFLTAPLPEDFIKAQQELGL